ncbi:MAG: FxsA family protein [Magnetococcus sp. DMHC-1]|nr:FxsA family protein [Magnetococcales bacterium]
MRRLGFGIFVVLPILEILFMARVGHQIGIVSVLSLFLLSGVWGVFLIRRAGLRTLRAWQESLERHEPPGNALLDGLIYLLAGVLLVVPGFITDFLALLLLFPPTRFFLKQWLLWYVGIRVDRSRKAAHHPGGPAAGFGHQQTIDGEFRREDP